MADCDSYRVHLLDADPSELEPGGDTPLRRHLAVSFVFNNMGIVGGLMLLIE